MEFYYDAPMQVRYLEQIINGAKCYALGIAFHEFIIDAKTGAVFGTKEILARCDDPDDAIIEWGDWHSLCNSF